MDGWAIAYTRYFLYAIVRKNGHVLKEISLINVGRSFFQCVKICFFVNNVQGCHIFNKREAPQFSDEK